MATIQISELTAITAATIDDNFIINDGNSATRRITFDNLLTSIAGQNLNFTGDVTFSGATSGISIDELSDVDTTTTAPVANQVLKWDGTNWVPSDDEPTTRALLVSGSEVISNTSVGGYTFRLRDVSAVTQISFSPATGDATFNGNVTIASAPTSGAHATTKTYVDTEIAAITAADLSLGNVDNTADADKPISTAAQTALDLKAPLASPTFTGVPAGPTATSGTSSTQFATTAFVQAALTAGTNTIDDLGDVDTTTVAPTAGQVLKWNAVDSEWQPADDTDTTLSFTDAALTGTPTAPTAAASTNTTQIATTAYVQTELGAVVHSSKADLDVDHLETLTGAGVAADDLGTFTGVTITDSSTIKVALQELETELETKQDALTGLTASVAELNILDGATLDVTELNYVDGVTSAIQTQIDAKLDTTGAAAALDVDHIITLSGVAAASDDLGTFTGAIITDSSTIKTALQELETEVELKAPLASPDLTGTPTAPTASQATNTTQLATTAFVHSNLTGSLIRTALGVGEYADDTAAGVGGLTTGELYYNTTDSAYILKS